MQSTSALYKRILSNQNHWFETKLLIVGVGEFDETKLFSISTNIEMFQNSPTIGTASAGEIEVKMLNPAEPIPTMATLIPYVRAVGFAPTGGSAEIDDGILAVDNATISNSILTFPHDAFTFEDDIIVFASTGYEYAESEWIPQGVYFVDTKEVIKSESNVDVLVLRGYDAMLKAEQPFQSNAITGNSTDVQMVNEIASIIGVEVDERTYDIMTVAYTIPLPTGYSCREVLGYIASMYVGSFIMTDEGKLRLVSILELPPETNYLIDGVGDAITFGGDRILV